MPVTPRFALPETVGTAMSAEAVAAVVLHSLDEIAAALPCPRLIALSYAPSEGLLTGAAAVGIPETSIRELRLHLSDFPAADRALKTQQIAVVSDAASLPECLHCLRGEAAIIPLILGSRPLAVLVGQTAPGTVPRSAEWQARARDIAARAALVVELERASAAYQNELRLRYSTREISAAILEGGPLSEIAEGITAIIAQLLRVERVALFLRDPASGKTRPVHLRNVTMDYGEITMNAAARHLQSARAVAANVPYYVRDLPHDPHIGDEKRALLRQENVAGLLVAPLHYSDVVRGSLIVYPAGEREFSPVELAIFQSFADMATLGVALSQQMEQQRAMAMAEERNRLAREMHDTVAQSLTGLSLQLETAQIYLASERTDAAREILTGARTLAKKALEDTRRAVQGLAPAPLEHLTPSQAIAAELQQVAAELDIKTQFLLTGEEQPLISDQQTALLRITQEVLNNARRHAQATRVRVGLQFDPDEVTLIIEDDGVGFDVNLLAAPGPEGGYGLFGITERARLLGGEVRIDSTPGWGTRIQARLPYRPASPVMVRQAPPRREPLNGGSMGHSVSAAPVVPPQSGDGKARIRVVIADDHAVTRQGVKTILEASGEITVVGEAEDGAQAVERARTLRPDVVLMDVQMPRVDGLEGLRRIREEQPDLPVVILTTFQTDETVRESLQAGARGYLLKDADSTDLIAAVRAAFRGESLLSPTVTARLAKLTQTAPAVPAEGLNERALEVLQLLASGARNKEIAAQLFISERTVEYHLSNIFMRLGVTNRTEAARAAIERGLIAS